MFVSAGFAVSLTLVPTMQQSTPLTPTGEWEVQSDGNTCFAIRSYGQDASRPQTQLILRQTPGDPSIGIMLASAHEGAGFSRRREGTLDLAPGGTRIPMSDLTDHTTKSGKRIVRFDLRNEQLDAFKAAKEMRLKSGADVSHHLQLVGTELGFAGAAACRRQVIRDWGFDPAVIDTLRTTATPIKSPGELISFADYPKLALARGESGSVRVRFTVTAAGKVENCAIIESAGAILDQETCRLVLARARYSPALDKDGKPVTSFKSLTFGWSMPR